MSSLSNVLMINRDDLMKWTGMGGSVDTTKLLPHIMTATDIHVQPILGTQLLDKCRELVRDDELGDAGNEVYEDLVLNYITPVLVYYTMWDMLPFLSFQIENGGLFTHTSENANSADEPQMQMIIKKFKDKGESYGRELSRFLCDNTDDYPELFTNTGDDIPPSYRQTFQGVVWGK